MVKRRIAYIDFMKGLCIMLVAMEHIDSEFFNSLLPNLEVSMKSFRMPMFFFLSGLMFKTYDGFSEFLRKKINSLIVTLLFFHFLCSALKLPLVAVIHHINPNVDLRFTLSDVIPAFFGRFWRAAGALWFLVALFNVNVIYYLICRYLKKVGVLIAVTLCSIVGYVLMIHKVVLPCELDISLVAMPFFMLGSCVKQKNWLEPSRMDKWGLFAFIPCVLFLYYFSADINLLYQDVPDYFRLYLIPFIAILSLFWFSKNLKYVPFVCYIGRYSIIVLGTHQIIITYLWCLLNGFLGLRGIQLDVITFVLAMLGELLVIKLMIVYFPRFTAQEDFFKSGWKLA